MAFIPVITGVNAPLRVDLAEAREVAHNAWDLDPVLLARRRPPPRRPQPQRYVGIL